MLIFRYFKYCQILTSSRSLFATQVLPGVPTCGEWKPDPYAGLRMFTCTKPDCHFFFDFDGSGGLGPGLSCIELGVRPDFHLTTLYITQLKIKSNSCPFAVFFRLSAFGSIFWTICEIPKKMLNFQVPDSWGFQRGKGMQLL